MQVPFVDLRAQYESIKNEIDQIIFDVIINSAFVGGKYITNFEQNFARYTGTEYCVGVGNGTDALFIALKTLDIGVDDEVITAANSFIATSEAITMTGAKVVFVDCKKKTYNIDVEKIEGKISSKTKAIIPVHLYGQPADMDPILDIAFKHNLYIIEDSAQAHGALFRGKKIGSISPFSSFSFFPGKNLGAYGDAGALVTNDADLAEKARMIANHGRKDKFNHEFEGVNSRLDGLQAAILDVKLKHLDKWIERRISIAKIYDGELEDSVIIPAVLPGVRHVYHLYVIRVNNRNKVREFLSEKEIQTGVHYPIPLPFLNAYKYLGHNSSDFPVAFSLKDEILSLPIHGSMPDNQVEYVVDQVKAAVRKTN